MTRRVFVNGVLTEETVDPGDAEYYAQEEQAIRLREYAETSVALNLALIEQLGPQIAYAEAVAHDPTADISTAQMLAVVKNLANVLSGTARAVSSCLEQLNAHGQIIVGTYDTTPQTGGPGPVNPNA